MVGIGGNSRPSQLLCTKVPYHPHVYGWLDKSSKSLAAVLPEAWYSHNAENPKASEILCRVPTL